MTAGQSRRRVSNDFVNFVIRSVRCEARNRFLQLLAALLTSRRMFALTLMTLVGQVSGTPYISGGDSPAGTDCSGLVSWVSNAATGRPVYGDRFTTHNMESALLARGFEYGS